MESEKLKHLLEHWIEHNVEHIEKYKEWAEKIGSESPQVAEILDKAIEKFEEGNKLLERAFNSL
ncbi:hypothetical protein DRP05_01130 [Archaeoglobales archaeon]|mgnify:CR=1 FL=1|nr:MAG: hypothetical protein DRP05_01130 [Archaeoglobales archaeon]